jgi:hypothetical protein
MLGTSTYMVKKLNSLVPAIFFVSSLLATSGCYLLQYEAVMETHLTLMEQYSTKLQYMADNGFQVSGGDWVEFEYPGERAEEFHRIVAESFPERKSLQAFGETLVLYQALTANPEILRGADPAADVAVRREALLEAIRRNRDLLVAEG